MTQWQSFISKIRHKVSQMLRISSSNGTICIFTDIFIKIQMVPVISQEKKKKKNWDTIISQYQYHTIMLPSFKSQNCRLYAFLTRRVGFVHKSLLNALNSYRFTTEVSNAFRISLIKKNNTLLAVHKILSFTTV